MRWTYDDGIRGIESRRLSCSDSVCGIESCVFNHGERIGCREGCDVLRLIRILIWTTRRASTYSRRRVISCDCRRRGWDLFLTLESEIGVSDGKNLQWLYWDPSLSSWSVPVPGHISKALTHHLKWTYINILGACICFPFRCSDRKSANPLADHSSWKVDMNSPIRIGDGDIIRNWGRDNGGRGRRLCGGGGCGYFLCCCDWESVHGLADVHPSTIKNIPIRVGDGHIVRNRICNRCWINFGGSKIRTSASNHTRPQTAPNGLLHAPLKIFPRFQLLVGDTWKTINLRVVLGCGGCCSVLVHISFPSRIQIRRAWSWHTVTVWLFL